jgi:HD-GYP domain-containing protein (c-di-GMP phosphodiesterase class II)
MPRISAKARTQTYERYHDAARHQKRVAELAAAIAVEMNLPKELVHLLQKTGIIPSADLTAPARSPMRTAQEYNDILNGSGYPLKQPGSGILLESSILAIADMAETMADTVETHSSHRPYHLTKEMEKVLSEIKNVVPMNDQQVVAAFVRLINLGKFKFQTEY